jgi:hypothetical protein
MHAEIIWIFLCAILLLRFWRTALFLSLCALISVVLFVLVTVADSTIHWLHII